MERERPDDAQSKPSFQDVLHRTRGVKKFAGVHSDEYMTACTLYQTNPLDEQSLRLLDTLFGGHSAKMLTEPAIILANKVPNLGGTSRLSRRQTLAMLAWFSQNWSAIAPFFHETAHEIQTRHHNISAELAQIQEHRPRLLLPSITEIIPACSVQARYNLNDFLHTFTPSPDNI
jgi:hypothetical protein